MSYTQTVSWTWVLRKNFEAIYSLLMRSLSQKIYLFSSAFFYDFTVQSCGFLRIIVNSNPFAFGVGAAPQ